jgi:hypothetical protein
LYTVKSYFTSPNGTQGNYFSIIVHGDAIGSHIESIDVFIDGTTHNLLSNESDDEKIMSRAVNKHINRLNMRTNCITMNNN